MGLWLGFKGLGHFMPEDLEDGTGDGVGRYAVGVPYDVRPPGFERTMGMFVNTVLVPSGAAGGDGGETVEQLGKRWVRDILPIARTPYDLVVERGFGCNVMLTFNVGMDIAGQAAQGDDGGVFSDAGVVLEPLNFSSSSSGTTPPGGRGVQGLSRQTSGGQHQTDQQTIGAKFDLTIAFENSSEDFGGWSLLIESGVGPVWGDLGKIILYELKSLLVESNFGQELQVGLSVLSPPQGPLRRSASHDENRLFSSEHLVHDRTKDYYKGIHQLKLPKLAPAVFDLDAFSVPLSGTEDTLPPAPYVNKILQWSHGPTQHVPANLLAHWDGNGPIRIFRSGFKAVTEQLQSSYRPVTKQLQTSYKSVTGQ